MTLPTEYSEILQQVCSRLPLCQLTDEDLSKNPQFTKLLLEVSRHVDETGLSVGLKKDLESVENDLRLQRKAWLSLEVVHRLLQEMLQEYHIRKGEANLTPEDRKFYETLAQTMLVTECTRLLDPSPTTTGDMAPLLGLEKGDLLEFLPAKQDLLQMRDRFQRELEAGLKKKCFSLLSYHQPETDGDSDVLKAAKALRLVMTLQDEKRRLQSETEKSKETAALIEKQMIALPQVLLRCLSLLQKAAMDFRLTAQSDIDRSNAQYLETKCNALFLKIRMEELQVLIDTYTPQKVEVHKVIRDCLEGQICAEEQEVATSRKILRAYEILGPEFEVLVEEYTRLKQQIASNKWTLQELSKSSQ